MSLELNERGFKIHRIWAPEEYEALSAEIEAKKSYGYYQKIIIADGEGKTLETPGSHITSGVMSVLDDVGFPRNLEGKTVLDIGCNAGFYSIVTRLRGARRVLGIDYNTHYIDQAILIRRILEIKEEEVEFRVGDGHALSPDMEKFDFVINTGVVYHLQNPMDFLTKIGAITNEMMFLESEMLIDPKYSEYALFIEKTYAHDISNWWIYGPKCLAGMARAAGFRDVEFKGFIWKPNKGTKTPEGYFRQGRGALVCRK